jgi:hypothetical protein
MGRRITSDDLEFVRENWNSMSNVKMAEILGINKASVTIKARELGLPDKRSVTSCGNFKRTEISEQIADYLDSAETIQELEARKKTLELEHIKEQIKDKENLKLKVKTEGPNVPDRILNGIILQKNDNFVALKLEKYIECFRYTDFFTGKAVII